MSTELTTSLIARKNILNNRYALQQLETHLALGGWVFEGETLFTKQQTAAILDIDERTIDRYLNSHTDELVASGYRLLKGKHLKNIRLIYANDMDVVRISPKASALTPLITYSREGGDKITFLPDDVILDRIISKL